MAAQFKRAIALFLSIAPICSATHAVAQVASPVAAPVEHQRLLPLQGGRNFRDLGGYRTADGRTVKWGLLFRSGSMHGLTPTDFAYLNKLGIRVVCDFRSKEERASEPVAWPSRGAPTVLADDYPFSGAGLVPPPVNGNKMSALQARAMMVSLYPKILITFKSQYRRMFSELLAGHAPLAFNCSGGKDRTGVAAALLLTALGVPRATVVHDYELTNRYQNTEAMLKSGKTAIPQPWAAVPLEVLKAMAAADPHYIEAVFAAIDRHAGGVKGYFRDEMGLSSQNIDKLRSLYLENGSSG